MWKAAKSMLQFLDVKVVYEEWSSRRESPGESGPQHEDERWSINQFYVLRLDRLPARFWAAGAEETAEPFADDAVDHPNDSICRASQARALNRVVAVPTFLIVADGQRRRCSAPRRSRSVVTPTYTVRSPDFTMYLKVSFLVATVFARE